ncbi:MAG: MoaD/ThiS family protein [Chloroflexi bacterium]|nr:MoaD/ThiS family protein [Chloroflexota bacterium]MYF79758.1 MoaD/ThiS family protein [Chloroflexota bacterium]MYK61856.1 MoaD/ThiS family protein [Chloroflexota bacterium]
MAVSVKIPTPLRRLTDQQSTVSADGGDVSAMIESLDGSFPGIKARLCDDSGELRHFVNIYVNGEDIRYLDGTDTGLSDGDEVSIVPAVAGG